MTSWMPGLLLAALSLSGCERKESAPQRADDRDAPSASSNASAAPSASAAQDLKAEQATVKALLMSYRKAIFSGNGEEAAKLVTAGTHGYFETMRKAALSLSASEVKAKRPFDKFMILILRVKIPVDKLKGWTGRQLFVYAVEQGMVGQDARDLEPGDVELDGDTGHVGAKVAGGVLPPKSGFRVAREEGVWKLDIMSITDAAEPPFLAQLSKIDPDQDKAMIKVIASMDKDKKIDASLFEPLETRAP